MKKIYMLALAALCVAGCSQNQPTKNEIGIIGDVSSATDTIWAAEWKSGEVVKTKVEALVAYEFNDEGKLTSQIIYDTDGKISEKSIREYNEEGKIVSSKTYKGDGSLYYSTEYTYTDGENYKKRMSINGRTSYTSESEHYFTDKRLDSVCRVTIEDGKKTLSKDVFEEVDELCTKEITYREDGSKLEKTFYHDENERVVKIVSPYSTLEFTYEGDFIATHSFSSEKWSGKIDYKRKFDDRGNWIELIEYDATKEDVTSIRTMTTRSIQYRKCRSR